MSAETDALFARLKGGAFTAADPNSIPQEGTVGAGNIQGTGFVQAGGAPRAPLGILAYTGTASPGNNDALSTHDARLVPITLSGLLNATALDIELGSSATPSVFKFALLSDLGQAGALTVLAVCTLSLGVSASAMRTMALSPSPVSLPPGNYWLLIWCDVTTGANAFVGYYIPYVLASGTPVSATRGGTWSTALAAGDNIVVDYTTFPDQLGKVPVGEIVGRVFGIAADF